jgi:hypothetical protein
MRKLFAIRQTGDPFNKTGWDVSEYENSFDEPTSIWFRGDISPIQGRDRAIRYLRRTYPGCKIRVER